jgi:flagellar basal-body rod protein FlgB
MTLYQCVAKGLIKRHDLKHQIFLHVEPINWYGTCLYLSNKKDFIMGIQISKAHDIMAKALDYRSARQGLIAGNIANEDTPFYKARDISFAKTLQAEARKVFDEPEVPTLKLARTDSSHFQSTNSSNFGTAELYYRGGHLARNDGNTVDLDVETTEMTKNSMMFQGIIAAMKKDSQMFKAVIEASRQTS